LLSPLLLLQTRSLWEKGERSLRSLLCKPKGSCAFFPAPFSLLLTPPQRGGEERRGAERGGNTRKERSVHKKRRKLSS